MGKVIDLMEYASNAAAQAAYVSDGALVLDQSYSETNRNDFSRLRDTDYNQTKCGQTFKAGKTGKLSACKFLLLKHGSPTGNIFATVYATSSGIPTGSALATSANIDVSTISSADYELITFTFPDPASLVSGTTYAIMVEGDWTLSVDNCIYFGIDSSPGYADGQTYYYVSPDWVAHPWDAPFYTYMVGLQCYSESTIKTQGSYALKFIAAITDSLNKTLTKTFSTPVNLSGINTVKGDLRTSRTGSNIKLGLHDSGGVTTEITPNIGTGAAFQEITFDLSGVSDANKDAIDSLIITAVNADAENICYLDNIRGDIDKVFSETVTTSEVFGRGITRPFSDVMTISDVYSRDWSLTRAWVETVTLTEITARDISIIFTDSLALTDSLIRQIGKYFTETLTISDLITKVKKWLRVEHISSAWGKVTKSVSSWTKQTKSSSSWSKKYE